MCRLFGLTAAPHRVRATFWLLEAPESLAVQSRREPDGTGLGVFTPDGTVPSSKVWAAHARQVPGPDIGHRLVDATTGPGPTPPLDIDVAVVLAGGGARGLSGVDKAMIAVAGVPLLHRVLAVVAGVPIVVVGPERPVPVRVRWTREGQGWSQRSNQARVRRRTSSWWLRSRSECPSLG